jgi:ferredoxin
MPMMITESCIDCASCEYECPTGAVRQGAGKHEIDPTLCDDCTALGGPRCRVNCPVDGIVPIDGLEAVDLARAV